MKGTKALQAKTVLDFLVMIHEQSYSQIGRELHITPQQFSDWIKKRRPIPQERLKSLSAYFQVDETLLVDERNFTKDLTPVLKIDIQMLLLRKKVETGEEQADIYEATVERLQKERLKQIRIGRLAAILNLDDETVNTLIDTVLDEIESGNTEKLYTLLFTEGDHS
ncbi:XRE family transcriptional regulator [Bacillus sp. OTU530]|uniref:XRE family transcriptional regulator n=1 Tax=Bacillus sp. OTU530 TaxID=3043862 RepID=UPI00313B195D